MKKFFKNKYFILLLTVSLVLLVCMGIYSSNRQKVTPVENGVAVLIKPFQVAFGWIADTTTGFFKHFGDVSELKTENDNRELENTVREYEKYKIENERLKSMLEFKAENTEYKLVAAKVSARDSLNWFDSFTINKGLDDGLAVNQPVITTAGLVGQINTYQTMVAEGSNPGLVIFEIALMHFILPGLLSYGIAEAMRKAKLIRHGDMKLDV